VFENSELRRIFGPKRDEVKGDWRKLHILHSSPNMIGMIKSTRMKWAEDIARMGEKRNRHKIFVEKPDGKRALGRPRRR
jgi:hypothetical protein